MRDIHQAMHALSRNVAFSHRAMTSCLFHPMCACRLLSPSELCHWISHDWGRCRTTVRSKSLAERAARLAWPSPFATAARCANSTEKVTSAIRVSECELRSGSALGLCWRSTHTPGLQHAAGQAGQGEGWNFSQCDSKNILSCIPAEMNAVCLSSLFIMTSGRHVTDPPQSRRCCLCLAM